MKFRYQLLLSLGVSFAVSVAANLSGWSLVFTVPTAGLLGAALALAVKWPKG